MKWPERKKLIEAPTGFFDKRYLERLHKIFTEKLAYSLVDKKERKDPGFYITSSPYMSILFSKAVLGMEFNIHELKILDLGSGVGYFLSALAVHQCKGYGIEERKELIKYARTKFARLPIKEGFQPQLIHGNYYDEKIFQRKFKDGTRIEDIDFFFCFPYNAMYAKKALVKTLAGPGKAKEGSFAYLTGVTVSDPNLGDDFLKKLGFKEVPFENLKHSPLVKKVSSPKVDEEILRIVNSWGD